MRDKELVHGQRVEKTQPALPRRQFCKLGAATALAAGLGFGLLTNSSNVLALGTNIKIEGVKAKQVHIDKTLSQIERESAPYQVAEYSPNETKDKRYMNIIGIPKESRFSVIIGTKEGEENLKKLVVAVFINGEKHVGGFDLQPFSKLVKEISGEPLSRADVYVQRGTFDYNGQETDYTNVYVFPKDENGRHTTSYKGGHVVFGASQYADQLFGSIAHVVTPVAVASK